MKYQKRYNYIIIRGDMMNGGFQSSRDEIGIDPTTVEIIDTLDVGSNNNNQGSQGPNQKGSKAKVILTKTLFAFGILLLMAIVAFGIYFYLNLGKKKVNNKPKFVLENKNVYIGTLLSDSILDYGDFAAVDISGCTLDTSNVNINKTGTYEYSMTCDGTKYTGNINIIEKYDVEMTSQVLYKTSSDVLIASEFLNTTDEYKYSIIDTSVNNYLYSPGGPYYVEIEITSEKDNKKSKGSSIFYVTENHVRSFLKCTSEVKEVNDASGMNYRIIDTFVFDNFKNYLNVPSRMYAYENLETEKYIDLIKKTENGKLTIDNISGYALRDDRHTTMKIAVDFTSEDFVSEAEEKLGTYNDIKEYYESMNYTCE